MAYLELRNISKTFSTVVAVQDFSLDIIKGSLVSFLDHLVVEKQRHYE